MDTHAVSRPRRAAPEAFAGAILNNPFLDIERGVTDPLDPLAGNDVAEWGDPMVPEELAAIRAWSPAQGLDGLTALPPTLVTCALSDPVVSPSHAMRYVHRLRQLLEDPGELYLDWVSATRHDGEVDDLEAMRLTARFFAFTLRCLGLAPGAASTQTTTRPRGRP